MYDTVNMVRIISFDKQEVEERAKQMGVHLTDKHWDAINFVKKYFNALQYIPEQLREDPNIVTAAIKKDPSNLRFVPKSFLQKKTMDLFRIGEGNVIFAILRMDEF